MSYRIGEAARQVGVSPSALRLWERQGLVHPARTGGRYRVYSDADLDQLRSIRRMRRVDRVNAPGIRRMLHGGDAPTRKDDRRVDGRLLRGLRTRRGLSLRDAAERTGLSTSFLSALERGVSGASISTLQRLTATYGASVLALFGAADPDRRHLVRQGDRAVLELTGSHVRIEQLARSATQLEPQLFVLGPGATSDGPYAHEGEEFLYLLAGAVTVWVGDDEVYELHTPGDALTFSSTLPHHWRNAARGETRLLWINTPPTF